MEGFEYDPRRVQNTFARIASSYGETPVLRRYDSASGKYVTGTAKGISGQGGSGVSSDSRNNTEREGSLLKNEQNLPGNNGLLTNDAKHSAKKSEAVKAIAEDYGFTDTSAQNIVRVTASMRKSAGSTLFRVLLLFLMMRQLKHGV